MEDDARPVHNRLTIKKTNNGHNDDAMSHFRQRLYIKDGHSHYDDLFVD